MMPKKKEGVAPGPREAQCSSVGEYQEGIDWGTGGGDMAYGIFGGGKPGKGKSFEM